jgi:hypothetical protein
VNGLPKKLGFCVSFCVCFAGAFSAWFLCAWRCAVLLFTYSAPRLLLHVLHEGTRLSVLSSPPASCSIRWSACVAMPPHQWQGGLPSRMAALFVRYCWVCFLLPAMCVMLLAPLASPAVAFVCVPVSDVCAPHISQLCAVGCRTV